MKDLVDKYNAKLYTELKESSKKDAYKIPTTMSGYFTYAFARNSHFNTENSTWYHVWKLKDDHIFKLYYSELMDCFAVKVFTSYRDLDMNEISNLKHKNSFIEIGEL